MFLLTKVIETYLRADWEFCIVEPLCHISTHIVGINLFANDTKSRSAGLLKDWECLTPDNQNGQYLVNYVYAHLKASSTDSGGQWSSTAM